MGHIRIVMYFLGALGMPGLTAFVIIATLRPATGGLADFELVLFDVQGGTISDRTLKLSDFKDTPVVLNFWASWCEPCREEVPLLVKTNEAYKDKNVQFIGVNIWSGGDTVSSATLFMDSFGATYPTGPDLSREIYPTYLTPLNLGPRASPLPMTVFITSDHKEVLRTWLGAIDEESLVSLLDQLVQG